MLQTVFTPGFNLRLATNNDEGHMSGHMNDITVTPNVETNQLTTFTGEEIVTQLEPMSMKQFDEFKDSTYSDVLNYLKRPRFIERIGITHTTSFSTFYPLTRTFFDTHFNLSSRFKGCNGVRFKTCFRVVAAATPQTGGLLRIFYDPIPSIGSAPVYSETYKNPATSMHYTAYTQLPGVEMDLRVSTAADFCVPYTHNLEYMPLIIESGVTPTETFSMGAVEIIDYLPIRYVGSKKPYITVYCWLEDVEVFGAVNDPVVLVTAQSGGVEDIEKDGPLSGPLYKLSKAATLIGGAIPSLSSMISPLAWALRASSNTLASFGYSRPLQLEAVPRAFLTTQHYQNNADGPDAAFNMGLLQANSVTVIDNIGFTNEDEMSIAYLVSKPACINRINIGETRLGRVYTLFLAPSAMWAANDNSISFSEVIKAPHLWSFQAPGTVVRPAPLMWLSTMFNKYRGGFRVTVKCNATVFHGGRMLLTYTPYSRPTITSDFTTIASGNPGFVDTDTTGINVIWDLREGNTCSLDCPYFSQTPFMRDDQPIGSFSLSVLDNLVVTGTTNVFLDFAIEVQGLPGFDFEEPHQGPYVVDYDYDVRSRDEHYAIGAVVPQSGQLINCSMPNEKCVGERITSLKQLLSRTEWNTLSTYKAFSKDFEHDKGVHLRHWFEPTLCTGTEEIEPGVFRQIGSFQMSTHNSILYAYLFARGATCFDILGDTKGVVNYGVFTTGDKSGQNKVASQIVETSGDIKVKAPFYNNMPKVYTVPAKRVVVEKNGGAQRSNSGYAAMNRPLMYYSTSNNVMIGKRAADDAQLGFFMYAPPLRYIASGVYTTATSVIVGDIDAEAYYQGLN